MAWCWCPPSGRDGDGALPALKLAGEASRCGATKCVGHAPVSTQHLGELAHETSEKRHALAAAGQEPAGQ